MQGMAVQAKLANAMQEQATDIAPTSGSPVVQRYVKVGLYEGSLGMDHIGVGVNSEKTKGFSPKAGMGREAEKGSWVEGEVKEDHDQIESLAIRTNPRQEARLEAALNQAESSSRKFHLYQHNCAQHGAQLLNSAGLNVRSSPLPRVFFEGLKRQFEPGLEEARADGEPLQGKFEPSAPAGKPEQAEPNRTGMPDRLKAGIEAVSGIDMSDVRVHANSDRPARLNALAYTQGNQIYLGPGQERHLPHEAWHAVQQKQGRVKPTIQLKDGVPVNDDEGLEGEAIDLGIASVHWGRSTSSKTSSLKPKDQLNRLLAGHPTARQTNIGAPLDLIKSGRQSLGQSETVFQQYKGKKRKRTSGTSAKPVAAAEAQPAAKIQRNTVENDTVESDNHIALFRGVHYYKKGGQGSGVGSVEWSDDEFKLDTRRSWTDMPTMSDFSMLALKTLMKELVSVPLSAAASSSSSSTSRSGLQDEGPLFTSAPASSLGRSSSSIPQEGVAALVDKMPDYPLRMIASFCEEVETRKQSESTERVPSWLDMIAQYASSWLNELGQEKVKRWWGSKEETTYRNALIERYVNNKRKFLKECVNPGQKELIAKHTDTGEFKLEGSPFISASNWINTAVTYAIGKKESGAVRGKEQGQFQGRVLIYIIPKKVLDRLIENHQIMNIVEEGRKGELTIPKIMTNQKEYTFMGNIPSKFLRGEVLISKKIRSNIWKNVVYSTAKSLLEQADLANPAAH